jgi:hypothetical protein
VNKPATPALRQTALRVFVLLLLALTLRAEAPSLLIASPHGLWLATTNYDRVALTDLGSKVLVAEDYQKRDYHPEPGQWTASGRFYAYPLSSEGGHSPWHRRFAVADTETRRIYMDSDLHEGDAVTEFKLSGDDTISYQVLDRSKEDWDKGIPGLPRKFSLAAKIAKLSSAK